MTIAWNRSRARQAKLRAISSNIFEAGLFQFIHAAGQSNSFCFNEAILFAYRSDGCARLRTARDPLEIWFATGERSWLAPGRSRRLPLRLLGLLEVPSRFEPLIVILPFEFGVAESSIESS